MAGTDCVSSLTENHSGDEESQEEASEDEESEDD